MEPSVYVNSQKLAPVDVFTYLGSTLSRNVQLDDEVNSRTAKASAAFGRLQSSVWNRCRINITTKLKVYRAVVLFAFLYASETWTVYQRHARTLNHFHLVCLWRILNIMWQDKVPDTQVLQHFCVKTNCDGMAMSVEWKMIVSQSSYCLENLWLVLAPMVVKRRGSKTLKLSLKLFDVDLSTSENLAANRQAWRNTIRKGALSHEERWISNAQEKRYIYIYIYIYISIFF